MICSYGDLELSKLFLKKDSSDDILDFQFPSLNFTKNKWFESRQIYKQLMRLGIKVYFRAGKVFGKGQKHKNKKKIVTFKCFFKNCEAMITYQQDNLPNSQLKLATFNNLHNHKKSKDPQSAKRQDINQFMLNLDENVLDDYSNTSQWKNKFDLEKLKALHILEKCIWQNNTEDEILLRISRKRNVKLRRFIEDKQNGKTQVIFMSNDTMIETFMKYGEVVSLGVTEDILTQRSVFGEKYAIGFFYVHDQNLRLLVVGTFVMTRQNELNYKKLFEFFFECICNDKDLIHTIITDSHSYINDSLVKIKEQRNYSYEILNDWLHVIQRDLKPKLINKSNGKEVLAVLTKCFNETILKKYNENIKEANQMLGEDGKHIVQQFQQHAHRYCLIKMPKRFQSVAISSSFVKQLAIRTNQLAYFKNHTGRLLYQFLFVESWLLKEANKVCSMRISVIKYYTDQLFYLRQKMQKKSMQILVRKYEQSKQCERLKIDDLTYYIHPDEKELDGAIVRYNLYYSHWQCQCNFIYLTGIPCEHIISLLTMTKGSLCYYINSRWYHNKDHLVFGKTLPGAHISNKTRRRN